MMSAILYRRWWSRVLVATGEPDRSLWHAFPLAVSRLDAPIPYSSHSYAALCGVIVPWWARTSLNKEFGLEGSAERPEEGLCKRCAGLLGKREKEG